MNPESEAVGSGSEQPEQGTRQHSQNENLDRADASALAADEALDAAPATSETMEVDAVQEGEGVQQGGGSEDDQGAAKPADVDEEAMVQEPGVNGMEDVADAGTMETSVAVSADDGCVMEPEMPDQVEGPAASEKAVGDDDAQEMNEDAAEDSAHLKKAVDVELDAPDDDRPRIVPPVMLNDMDCTLTTVVSSDPAGSVLTAIRTGAFSRLISGIRGNCGIHAGRYAFEIRVLEIGEQAASEGPEGSSSGRVGRTTSDGAGERGGSSSSMISPVLEVGVSNYKRSVFMRDYLRGGGVYFDRFCIPHVDGEKERDSSHGSVKPGAHHRASQRDHHHGSSSSSVIKIDKNDMIMLVINMGTPSPVAAEQEAGGREEEEQQQQQKAMKEEPGVAKENPDVAVGADGSTEPHLDNGPPSAGPSHLGTDRTDGAGPPTGTPAAAANCSDELKHTLSLFVNGKRCCDPIKIPDSLVGGGQARTTTLLLEI
eukprot:GHVU01124592.1.p1 GENE.GHVU01124592.1~~GHVU01124592.1.p1  ORF type:complete len:484 (+),score=93.27 GHVU01124592.1:105-1556(+)